MDIETRKEITELKARLVQITMALYTMYQLHSCSMKDECPFCEMKAMLDKGGVR